MFLSICLNPVLQKTIVLNDIINNQVNRSNEYYFDIAGKGINVARILSQLKANVSCITQTGGNLRKTFNSLAKNDNFKLINIDSKSSVRFCYTLINKNDNSVSEIVENGEKIDESTETSVLNNFNKLILKNKYLIISGTKAPGYKSNTYINMIKIAKENNKKIILDFRGKDLINCLKFKPDFIKPNYREFCSTFFPNEKSFENKINKKIHLEVKKKMLELFNKYNINTILTNGKEEILYTSGNKINIYKPKIIVPKNTIGSGDAFTAGFIYKLNETQNIHKSIIFGSSCAKKNALLIRPGTIK